MKFLIGHLLMISLAAIIFVGCSGQDDAPQPVTQDLPSAAPAPSEPESPATVAQPSTETAQPSTETTPPSTETADSGTEAAGPNADDPAPGTAVAQPGDPGSITGAVKSPFAVLAQGAVYIVRVDGRDFPPPEEHAVMDQKNLIFLPHVLPVVVGSTVDFPNSDTVRHNVFAEKESAQQFNLGTYDVGIVKEITFDKLGSTHLGCNVHTEMSAYILVCQNPYFAITAKGTAKFVIADVPPGKWHLRLFHERLKSKTIQVEVKPGEKTSVDFTDLEKK